MKKDYIVGACRTAIGSFGDSLKDISAVELGSIVIKEDLKRSGISAVDVEAEIVGIERVDNKTGTIIINKDEYIRANATIEQLAKLKPAFDKNGTVTAGNASCINDGAETYRSRTNNKWRG